MKWPPAPASVSKWACMGLVLAHDKIINIGASNQSGLHADPTLGGTALAARDSAEDAGRASQDWTIEGLLSDLRNNPDVGVATAREWFGEDRADVIVDVPGSGFALAATEIVKEQNGGYLKSGAATSDLMGKARVPHTVHGTYHAYAPVDGTGNAVVNAGGETLSSATAGDVSADPGQNTPGIIIGSSRPLPPTRRSVHWRGANAHWSIRKRPGAPWF